MIRKVAPLLLALLLSTLALTPASANEDPGSTAAGASAQLNSPSGVAVDGAGNLYIADSDNHRIRKISPDGTVTTVAGTGTGGSSAGDGSPTGAQLLYPRDVVVDQAGNLYIADTLNHRIRKLSSDGTTITTIAGTGTGGSSTGDGSPTGIQLFRPNGLALDTTGNLYIADTNNHRIRKLSSDGTTITTIAGTTTHGNANGDGTPTSAQLNFPHAVAVDRAGNVYIADTFNHRIRKVNSSGTTISTVAGIGTEGRSEGNGTPTTTEFSYPRGVAIDSRDNLYVTDSFNHRIRKLSADQTSIRTIGSELNSPRGISVVDDSRTGVLYIADTGNDRVQRLTLPDDRVLTGVYKNASGTRGSVARLYMAVFGRQPDTGGFAYWNERIQNGLALPDAAAYFVVSPEFVNLYGSTANPEFVELLYQNVLGRTSDADGKAYWIGQLGSGMTRTELTLWFSESPEFRNVTETS